MPVEERLHEVVALKDLPVSERDVKDATFHLGTFGTTKATYHQVFAALAEIDHYGDATPKLYGHAVLPEIAGFELRPIHSVLLAHGLKNHLERLYAEEVRGKPRYLRAGAFGRFFLYKRTFRGYVETMQRLLSNHQFRSQLRDALLAYSGRVVSEDRVYAKEKPGRPDRSSEDLELVTPFDLVEKYLEHRPAKVPRTPEDLLTDQHRQWLADGALENLPRLHEKLEKLHRDLDRHHAGLLAVMADHFPEYNSRYARSLSAELAQQLQLTAQFLKQVEALKEKVSSILPSDQIKARRP